MRNADEFLKFANETIDDKLGWWIESGALPDSPNDKPSSSVKPIATALIPDSVYGFGVQEVHEEWLNIYGGGPSTGFDYDGIWVLNDDGYTKFMRVMSVNASPEEAVYFQTAFKTQMQLMGMSEAEIAKVELTTFLGRPAVVTPRIGIPLDWAVETGVVTKSMLPKVLEKGAAQYDLLCDAGGMQFYDTGYQQMSVVMKGSDDFDIFIADLEKPVWRTSPQWRDPATYKAEVRKFLEMDLDDLGKGGFYLPTTVAPIAPAIEQAASSTDDLIYRVVQSDVDGLPYEIGMTKSEWVIVYQGGDDALRLLANKGLPMPPVSGFTKGLRIVGRILGTGLVIVGIGATVYIVGEQIAEAIGLTSIYQVGWLEFQPNVVPVEYDKLSNDQKVLYESMASLWYQTALYHNYYDIRVMNDRYITLPYTGGCHNFTLNDPAVVGVPTVAEDLDVVTPFYECNNGAGEMVFGNMLTGEVIVWSLQSVSATENKWMQMQGNTCLQPAYVTVERITGDKFMTQFEMCVYEGGLSFKPVLFKTE